MGAAALVAGWGCRRLGIPEVIGYLAAGVLLGPHTPPYTLVANVDSLRALAGFAVVFRMFNLGLEFDVRRLSGRWRPALFAGVLEVCACAAAGLLLATMLGWTMLEGAVLGAALGTTSTSLLTRALADMGAASRSDARAAGAVTLVEDLLAMTMLALLAIAHGSPSLPEMLQRAGWLALLAGVALTAGAMLVPLALDRLQRAHADDLLTVAVVAILFGLAALSMGLGAGPAIGAFLAGAVVGVARHAPGVSARIVPVRDLLTTAFFVSAGMLLQPLLIVEVAPIAALVALAFVPLKIGATALGLRLGGVPVITAGRAGAILGQTGTLGIVVAAGAWLEPDAAARLFAFAFVAWALTVALTKLRLAHLPDLVERLAKRAGASDRLAAGGSFVRPARAEDLALLRRGLGAAGGAVAALAAAVFAASAAAFLPWGVARLAAAAAVGLAAGFVATPFALVSARALARLARDAARPSTLRPSLLNARHDLHLGEGVGVVGATLALALVGAGGHVLARRFAPGGLELALVAGALVAALLVGLVPPVRHRLVAWAWAASEPPSGPVDVRLNDFRGMSPFGFEVEAVLVTPQTRGAWHSLRELRLPEASGATVVAVLRAGSTTPERITPALRLRPGDEVVLAGTPAQVLGARRLLQEPVLDAGGVRPASAASV